MAGIWLYLSLKEAYGLVKVNIINFFIMLEHVENG